MWKLWKSTIILVIIFFNQKRLYGRPVQNFVAILTCKFYRMIVLKLKNYENDHLNITICKFMIQKATLFNSNAYLLTFIQACISCDVNLIN